MKSGLFITFEGVDGAGKTTLMKGIAERLRQNGKQVFSTRAPGGTQIGEEIRNILLHSKSPVSPYAELFLFLADRAQSTEELIRPALDRKEIVLCDRFHDSTIAYQAAARGLDPIWVEKLCLFASKDLVPTLTFCLDLAPEIAQKRTVREKDRIEQEGLAFHQKIREGFLTLARKDSKRMKVLDATKSPESLLDDAMKEISCFL